MIDQQNLENGGARNLRNLSVHDSHSPRLNDHSVLKTKPIFIFDSLTHFSHILSVMIRSSYAHVNDMSILVILCYHAAVVHQTS